MFIYLMDYELETLIEAVESQLHEFRDLANDGNPAARGYSRDLSSLLKQLRSYAYYHHIDTHHRRRK
jgi:hypothetical protein